MAELRVDVDISDALEAVEAYRAAVTPPNVTAALEDGMRVLQRGAQDRAPRESGQLARSIELTVVNPTTVTVATGLVYAAVQEFGARIRHRRQENLRFSVRGRLVFTQRPVRIRAQPFWLPTFDADAGRAEDEFMRAIVRDLN